MNFKKKQQNAFVLMDSGQDAIQEQVTQFQFQH